MCEILEKFGSEKERAYYVELESYKRNILNALELKDLGVNFKDLLLSEEDVNNPVYFHSVDGNEKMEFATAKKVNLYKYVAHSSSGYGSKGTGSDTRKFCSQLMARTNTSLMRYHDILKLNGSQKGMGLNGSNVYNVFKFRGGNHCKHVWVKFVYDINTQSLVKATDKLPANPNAGDV